MLFDEDGRAHEMGRNTFLWYRIYCLAMAFLYLAVTGAGIFFAVVPLEQSPRDQQQMFIMGIVYAILGGVFFIVYAVATFLPPKPYNWIVGIVMLTLGMTSCCLLPAVIPLLIFWVRPETQAFLGRKQSS